MSENASQEIALRQLVNLGRPVPELGRVLRALPYDYSGTPIVLSREHVAQALRRSIEGVVTLNDLRAWAELIEGRPGIEFEAGQEELLNEIVFQIATPEITSPNSIIKCQRLLEQLV